MNLSAFLSAYGRSVRLEPREYFFRQGEESPKFGYVATGLLKASFVTYEGKEYIKSFVKEGDVIGSLRAVCDRIALPFSLVAIEQTELIAFDLPPIFERAREDREMANELIQALMQLALKKERREFEFLALSPESRYQSFVDHSPDLIDRVTQNDVARYLGITPVALSRIRRRMAERR